MKTLTIPTNMKELQELLKENPVCDSINKLEITPTKDEEKIWLNPDNQNCFNYGLFTFEDFYNWTQKRGKIVKGNTDEEKQKFFEVAEFIHNHNHGWAILAYKKYFDLLDNSYYPQRIINYVETINKFPLKITKNNHGDIIGKIFGNISEDYANTELVCNSHSYSNIIREIAGAKLVLFNLGIGYYGACNTPEDILNLSWIGDICIYKAVYRYFIKNNIPLPDFDFVNSYNNK